VLACATGQIVGLEILCLDVCVKGHQESNLKPRSEDRSFANAPKCHVGEQFIRQQTQASQSAVRRTAACNVQSTIMKIVGLADIK
jgi:hypothetical protein